MEEFKNLQETKLTSQPIFDGDVLHIYKDTVCRCWKTAPCCSSGRSAMPWAKS